MATTNEISPPKTPKEEQEEIECSAGSLHISSIVEPPPSSPAIKVESCDDVMVKFDINSFPEEDSKFDTMDFFGEDTKKPITTKLETPTSETEGLSFVTHQASGPSSSNPEIPSPSSIGPATISPEQPGTIHELTPQTGATETLIGLIEPTGDPTDNTGSGFEVLDEGTVSQPSAENGEEDLSLNLPVNASPMTSPVDVLTPIDIIYTRGLFYSLDLTSLKTTSRFILITLGGNYILTVCSCSRSAYTESDRRRDG